MPSNASSIMPFGCSARNSALCIIEVGGAVEIDLMASAERQALVAPYGVDPFAARDGIDVFRHLPHQAGNDSKVGAMAHTGQRQ